MRQLTRGLLALGRRQFRGAFLGCVLGMGMTLACSTQVVTSSTIDFRYQLPSDFALTSAISQVDLVWNERPDEPSLYTAAETTTVGQTADPFAFNTFVEDVDGDGKFERGFVVFGNPFSASRNWTFIARADARNPIRF